MAPPTRPTAVHHAEGPATTRVPVTRRARTVVPTAAATVLDPAVLAGAAVEAAWLAAHLATWPMGLVTGRRRRSSSPAYRLENLPPVQRGLLVSNVEAAGTPILLVHGIVSNRSIFTLLRRGLTRRGFSKVFAMNYLTLATDVRTAAARLSVEVERVVEETGFERIHIIGHSLGGLIARYYVTRLGGDVRVHTLVTLGTPHDGTYAAYAVPTRLMRQMRPGSGLMRELARPGARLSDEVHLLLVRQRRRDPSPGLRGAPAPRSPRHERPAARGGPPHPADAGRGRPRHLQRPRPPRRGRHDRHPRRHAAGAAR